MLAYNSEHLDCAEILKNARIWNKSGVLGNEHFDHVLAKYVHPLYTPNLFIRIGLFIFTIICASTANSFLFLITGAFESGSDGSWGIRLVINGVLLYFALEYLIKEKHIYKSGIDDALLYMGLGSIISGICVMFFSAEMQEENTMLLFACISLPVLVAGAIRYSDMLVSLCAYLCSFLILFLVVSKTGEISKYVLPFVIMIVTALAYFQLQRLRKMDNLRFWDSSLWLIEIVSLILFYAAGNYFVVRTLSEVLFDMNLQAGEDIPLAFIFYAFTALVPIGYIFFGLKNKNRELLQSGLILVAVSVLTFKYYYGLGHHEITLTVSGIVMISIAWFAIKYLKEPKFGLTYAEDKDAPVLENFDAEALIIAQTFSDPNQNLDNNTSLGGGNFGGGGASGGY